VFDRMPRLSHFVFVLPLPGEAFLASGIRTGLLVRSSALDQKCLTCSMVRAALRGASPLQAAMSATCFQ